MRTVRRLIAPFTATLAVVSALGLAGAASVAAAPDARADTIAPLTQLTGFHQMVVDSADDYVFFSEGSSSGGLMVTDLAGNYVTTIYRGDDVEGIALSTNGTALFAALPTQHVVAAVDIATIKDATPTQTLYMLPSSDAPYAVAEQSGKLRTTSTAPLTSPAP